MNGRKVDPRQQFSKKLAGRAEWFWFGYMIVLAGVMAFTPAAVNGAVYLAVLATIVMVVSVMAYTRNSIYEKGLYNLRVVEKLKLGKAPESAEDDPAEDEEAEEEGGNG